MRSSAHGTALMDLLQLASGQRDGIVANLGQNNRSQWISNNIEVFSNPGDHWIDIIECVPKCCNRLQQGSFQWWRWRSCRSTRLGTGCYNLFLAANNDKSSGRRSENIIIDRNKVAASLVDRKVLLGTLGGWQCTIWKWNNKSDYWQGEHRKGQHAQG